MERNTASEKVRYAVVGLGWIAQTSVLPAFKNAKSHSELVALISSDTRKLEELGDEYGVKGRYSYEDFERCLELESVDAVYIALPNHLHLEFTERAARAGVHVLCEKPMALSTEQCQAMIDVCEQNQVKLMVAYRLHFEEANLRSIEMIKEGAVGQPRFLQATFSMQAAEGNYRLDAARGGGPCLDLGVYCINAARYLFGEEPIEVQAMASHYGERFDQVEEMATVTMRFPEEKHASFTCSFGAADVARWLVVGTKGSLELDAAFELKEQMTQTLRQGETVKESSFEKRDQFGPELVYFSECILEDREPEPSGSEGKADLAVLEAISRSLVSGRKEPVNKVDVGQRPTLDQEIFRPPVGKAKLVHTQQPSVAV